MMATTSRVGFFDRQYDIVSLSHQRAPNNISIKIDTTQEYMQDEVSQYWQPLA